MQPAYKKYVNPNPVPYPGPGDIDALTETKTFEVTALNQSFSDQFTMPEGYSRIVAVTFDPNAGAFISLKSQRAKQDIMANFNTLGIGNGIFYLGTKDLNDDVINYSMTFFSQGNIAAAIWTGAVRQDVPTIALPYKHSLTLIYGR